MTHRHTHTRHTHTHTHTAQPRWGSNQLSVILCREKKREFDSQSYCLRYCVPVNRFTKTLTCSQHIFYYSSFFRYAFAISSRQFNNKCRAIFKFCSDPTKESSLVSQSFETFFLLLMHGVNLCLGKTRESWDEANIKETIFCSSSTIVNFCSKRSCMNNHNLHVKNPSSGLPREVNSFRSQYCQQGYWSLLISL